MQLFYVSVLNEDTCLLGEEESWHTVKVLRFREGDSVNLTDGMGWLYDGKLLKVHPKECIVGITGRIFHQQNGRSLHIAIAPTKNNDRFEWFIEKATEIGVDEITPLLCDHSERETLKMKRLENVLISAMKQSLKVWLPLLHDPVKFHDFVKRDASGMKLIAHCETGHESALHKIYQPDLKTTILIGPEGDFSKPEVELAINSGFIPVNLGTSRLRTETAGVVACTTIGILNS